MLELIFKMLARMFWDRPVPVLLGLGAVGLCVFHIKRFFERIRKEDRYAKSLGEFLAWIVVTLLLAAGGALAWENWARYMLLARRLPQTPAATVVVFTPSVVNTGAGKEALSVFSAEALMGAAMEALPASQRLSGRLRCIAAPAMFGRLPGWWQDQNRCFRQFAQRIGADVAIWTKVEVGSHEVAIAQHIVPIHHIWGGSDGYDIAVYHQISPGQPITFSYSVSDLVAATRATAAFLLGIDAFGRRDHEQAEKFFDLTLTLHTSDQDEFARLVSFFAARNAWWKARYGCDFTDALTRARRLRDLSPTWAPGLTVLGRVELSRKNYVGADSCFDEALKADPDYYYALTNKAQRAFAKGDTPHAEALLTHAITVGSDYSAIAHHDLSILLFATERSNEARNEILTAIRLSPSFSTAWSTYAYLQLHTAMHDSTIGRVTADSVIQACQRAITLEPHNTEAYEYLYETFAATGDKAAQEAVLSDWEKAFVGSCRDQQDKIVARAQEIAEGYAHAKHTAP